MRKSELFLRNFVILFSFLIGSWVQVHAADCVCDLCIGIPYIVGIPIKDFIGYYNFTVYEGRVSGNVSGDTLGEETLYDETPFKEGSLLITNDGSYLKFSLNGTLKNGKHTATTIVVPVKDIRIVKPMH